MAISIPKQKILNPIGRIYSPLECQQLLMELIDHIDWQYEYNVFGRRFTVPRLQAWYADVGVHYRYSDNMLESKKWNPLLLKIKQLVEHKTGNLFNSVLATYYRNGDDHVTWHADDEPELGELPVIASLSLGATRTFQYRHKITGAIGEILLNDGELIVMNPKFQHKWEHAVPIEPHITTPRINLTFRTVVTAKKS